ncbi:uncharacterized protein LOC134230021 [Saccostrea cucullata]|uniref:uncharacterized protein LOC134230021 n=1 Tax=Saccostrea cuccullata TaxID=36930 RepID=UPI002ED03382
MPQLGFLWKSQLRSLSDMLNDPTMTDQDFIWKSQSLSEMLSDPTMSKLLMGGGGGAGGLGAAGLGGGLGGLGGGIGGLGGESSLNLGSLMENPMQMLTDPTMRQLLTSGGGASAGGIDPATLSALIDMQSAPLLDTNMLTQLSQLNDLIPPAPTTPKPTKPATVKPASTINLSIGGSSATLGKDQSLADLIKRLQLKRKKKEAAEAAAAAIETVPNGNLGAVFSETLKPSNLNPNLPVAKILELAKDGIGVAPNLQNMVCPTKQCPFPLACGNPVKTYTPETFFVCPECPMCPGDILKGVSARLGKVVRIANAKKKKTKAATSNSARYSSYDVMNFAG